jgi:mono/diheme cytochrome c family protein
MSLKAGKVPQIQAFLQLKGLNKRLKAAVLLLTFLLLFVACGGGADDDAPEEAVPSDPVAAEGQKVFKQNCASCHAITADTIIVGPSLAGITGQAATRVEGQSAEEYIQLSILRPDEYIVEGFSDLMPSNFGTTLSGEQLDALLAYLMTLE